MSVYILFESASGFALFSVNENEEVGQYTPKQQTAMQSFKKFAKVVKMEAFRPFKSPASALENINDISEGVLNGFLKDFLKTNLPLSKDTRLGVVDQNLTTSIQEALGVKCIITSNVLEIHRFIRLHFDTFLKGYNPEKYSSEFLDTSYRGLGHSYGRAKMKFNVNRDDNIIIQCISLLDQMVKDFNTLAMRIKEWYSWHFPELAQIVKDNDQYVQVTHYMKVRTNLNEESLPALNEITEDESVSDLILRAARTSMGMDLSEVDIDAMVKLTSRAVSFSAYKKDISEYLIQKMNDVAPNLSALIGEIVAARLINHAGSLTNLAKCPASTIQILGAEKALFRALKSRKGNTPKYGLIFNSTFISNAKPRDKGRISRYLANKCAIAARLDCFYDHATNIFGLALREQVQQRLVFYDTGKAPEKNVDVMHEVLGQASELFPQDEESQDADLSSKRKRSEEMDVDEEKPNKKKSKEKRKSKKEKRKSKSKN
eukprot:TRINITY_DN11597_c0_g1_i1.p1 TRINITY_DN11597_c0_g1~~TRINITY_DN11597_c0_g1_i1.p1  ORF type:complete len:487 (+),score=124.95 TRINITY_DN11597_c0_g1_i1:74-1534(+)